MKARTYSNLVFMLCDEIREHPMIRDVKVIVMGAPSDFVMEVYSEQCCHSNYAEIKRHTLACIDRLKKDYANAAHLLIRSVYRPAWVMQPNAKFSGSMTPVRACQFLEVDFSFVDRA